jgi:uncharacterized protein YggE
MARVEQKPTLLRMTIQLQEKAATVKEALAKLTDRRDAAILQLESLGAEKAAVTVSEFSLAAQSEQERQMQRMMMQQMRSRGRVPKGLSIPKSVTLVSTLTAEWPLTMASTEELLEFSKSLQDKIRAADLAGVHEPKKLTPEEEEVQEEMREMMSDYGEGQPDPGEPVFLYVAKLSDADREKAMASAFAMAQAEAQRLAQAAGAKLGSLSALSGGTSQLGDARTSDYEAYAMRMALGQAAGASMNEHEAVTPEPGMIKFQVMVNASFRLE